jgi:signal transduction histidine kinase
LSRQSKIWIFALGVLAAGQILAAVTFPRGFAVTALSDVVQCLVLLSAAVACLPIARESRGRVRLFWMLMAVGHALWLSYQVIWTYFEIFLRREVPELFSGDIVLFLHIVPMMAALALQPQRQQDDRTTQFGVLDFSLLLVWWVFLFVFAVLPWQYVVPNELYYNQNLNTLYMAEKIVFLAALALVWFRSSGSWKVIYAHFFGASLAYGLSSYLANQAIERHVYYTGSLYDVPLVSAMAWFTLIPLLARDSPPKQQSFPQPTSYGVWVARLGMVAISSLPLFALWALFDRQCPPGVELFRLKLTLATMLLMGTMVFVKQKVADRELLRLLRTSQKSLEDLKLLQLQLVQSEKLASMGQLVGGAAHELNNPLTAMLGYADLLATTQLNPEQRSVAEKIGQQVRKTKALVASLLSFARQVPGDKSAVDLSSLVRTAVNHCQPHLVSQKIEIRTELASDLPPVLGDSNQLLQVCLHMTNHALHALDEGGGGVLTVTTRARGDMVALEFCDLGSGLLEPPGAPDPFYTKRPSSESAELGLGACQGIVREHSGRIVCENRPDGGRAVRIELPSMIATTEATGDRPGKAAAVTASSIGTTLP